MTSINDIKTYLDSNLVSFYNIVIRCQTLLTSGYYPLHLISKVRGEIISKLENEIRGFQINHAIPSHNYLLLYPHTALLFQSEELTPVIRFICEMPLKPKKQDRSLWLLLFTCSIIFNRIDISRYIFENMPDNAIYTCRFTFYTICKYAPTEFTKWFHSQMNDKYSTYLRVRLHKIIDSCPISTIIWLVDNNISKITYSCLLPAKKRKDYEEIHAIYRERKRLNNQLFDISKNIKRIS